MERRDLGAKYIMLPALTIEEGVVHVESDLAQLKSQVERLQPDLHKTFFHGSDIQENLGRLSAGVEVCDGSDYFFRLLYDPETGSCSQFSVNGVA